MVSINIFEDISAATLARVSNLLESVKDGDDLELNICSYGGLILDTFGIIDLIQSKHLKTTANIVGFAASAAAILALSCDVVTMSSLGSLMIHSAWSESELADSNDPGIKRCNQVQLQIINKRCKAINDKTLKQDHWYSADECLELGLIDKIQNNSTIINAFYAKLKSEVLPMDEKVQEVVENIKELVESGDVSPETASDVVEELHEDVRVGAPVAEEPSGDSEKLSGDSEKMPTEEEKPNDHDLLEVIEKLTEEVMNLKARVLALEDVKVDETVVDEPKAESNCGESDDEKIKNRINNIYNSITMPQAVIANAPKAKNVVQKVDYKTYKAFINEY